MYETFVPELAYNGRRGCRSTVSLICMFICWLKSVTRFSFRNAVSSRIAFTITKRCTVKTMMVSIAMLAPDWLKRRMLFSFRKVTLL